MCVSTHKNRVHNREREIELDFQIEKVLNLKFNHVKELITHAIWVEVINKRDYLTVLSKFYHT